jgi:hypothetical protein
MHRVSTWNRQLTGRALEGLGAVDGITIYGPHDPGRRTSLVAFNLRGRDPRRMAEALNQAGIEARAGCHCATLAHHVLDLNPPASCRLSFYLYNTPDEVDRAVAAVTATATIMDTSTPAKLHGVTLDGSGPTREIPFVGTPLRQATGSGGATPQRGTAGCGRPGDRHRPGATGCPPLSMMVRLVRTNSPGLQTMLSMPVSSSRLRKVMPPAVAGRCRWVTAPPTRIRVPSGTLVIAAVGRAPRWSRWWRRNSTGWRSGEMTVVHTSAAVSSRAGMLGRAGAVPSAAVLRVGDRHAVPDEQPMHHTQSTLSVTHVRVMSPACSGRFRDGRPGN